MKMTFWSRFALALTLAFLARTTNAQSYPPTLVSPVAISGQQFGTSPSLAVYESILWAAYSANSSADQLWITGTTSGTTWSTPVAFATVKAGTAPAIAVHNSLLWVAWIDDGKSGRTSGALYLAATASPGSAGWTNGPYLVSSTGSPFYPNGSPTLAEFGGNLWITAVYDYSGTSTTMETYSTSNGTAFTSQIQCSSNDTSYQPQVGAAAGMVAFNGLLYVAYQTQGGAGGHTLRVCATNGSTLSYYSPGWTVGSGVSAMVYGSYLVFGFKDYSSHDLILEGSTNGSTYSESTQSVVQINGNQEINPSIANWSGLFTVAFTGNSSSHQAYASWN